MTQSPMNVLKLPLADESSPDGLQTMVFRTQSGPLRIEFDERTQELRLHCPEGISVAASSDVVRVSADERLELSAKEVKIDADRLTAKAKATRFEGTRFEVVATSIRHTTEELLQDVREMMHTRAGRLRQIVEGSLHTVAERTTIRSRKDTTIDGKHVYLG